MGVELNNFFSIVQLFRGSCCTWRQAQGGAAKEGLEGCVGIANSNRILLHVHLQLQPAGHFIFPRRSHLCLGASTSSYSLLIACTMHHPCTDAMHGPACQSTKTQIRPHQLKPHLNYMILLLLSYWRGPLFRTSQINVVTILT